MIWIILSSTVGSQRLRWCDQREETVHITSSEITSSPYHPCKTTLSCCTSRTSPSSSSSSLHKAIHGQGWRAAGGEAQNSRNLIWIWCLRLSLRSSDDPTSKTCHSAVLQEGYTLLISGTYKREDKKGLQNKRKFCFILDLVEASYTAWDSTAPDPQWKLA